MKDQVEHFRVECRIDGKWFSNALVFPDRGSARQYGREMVECGAAERYRVTITDALVNQPRDEEEGESEPSNGGGSPSFLGRGYIDWAEFFNLVILCPAPCMDDDLERLLVPCASGFCLGRVEYCA